MSVVRFTIGHILTHGLERRIRDMTVNRLEGAFVEAGVATIFQPCTPAGDASSNNILEISMHNTQRQFEINRYVIFLFPPHSSPDQVLEFKHLGIKFSFSPYLCVGTDGVEKSTDVVYGQVEEDGKDRKVPLTIYSGAMLHNQPEGSDITIKSDGGEIIGLKIKKENSESLIVGVGGAFTSPFIGESCNRQYYNYIVDFVLNSHDNPLNKQGNQSGSNRTPSQPSIIATDETCAQNVTTLFVANHTIKQSGFLDGNLVNPYENVSTFLQDAYLRGNRLPRAIHEVLYKFKSRDRSTHPALLLRGLLEPTDVPATPSDIAAKPKALKGIPELWIGAMAEHLGYAVGYMQEKGGRIFQNLFPTKQNETKLSSESSIIDLDFHTEIAFHPHLPDYLILFCLRSDHDKIAATFYSTVEDIIRDVDDNCYAILRKPLFKTGIDFSFGSSNGRAGNGRLTPILYGDPFSPFLCYDLDLMTGTTSDAQDALKIVRSAANRTKRSIVLECGDLLIVDNRRVVHGRSNFLPRYDGQDRWLIRTSVLADIQVSAADRRSHPRVIETLFKV